jgi:hypothetical protein
VTTGSGMAGVTAAAVTVTVVAGAGGSSTTSGAEVGAGAVTGVGSGSPSGAGGSAATTGSLFCVALAGGCWASGTFTSCSSSLSTVSSFKNLKTSLRTK